MSVTASLTTNVETITASITVDEETITAEINTAARGPAGPAGGGGGASAWDDLTGTATSIPFEPTTAPAHSEGLVFYDESDHSLSYYVDEEDVTMNIGREMWIRVRNDTGSTILNGKVVYLSGATGQTPTIALARADSLTTSRVIGIATHDIENNSFGYVTTAGEVKGLDTSAFLDGAMLYLSAATAGELTATAPTAPNRIIQVATVSHAHITQGKLYAHPESDSIDSTGIADSTATGRALVTAANAAAARSTLGAAASGANTDITSLTGLGLGTVSSPTFTFGDADSGFYAPNSTSIAYAVDGVQKFRFDSAGMTVTSPGGAASRTLTVFDASTSFSAGLNASSTQAFGFGDITTSTVGRFERSTTTGLVSFQMQGVSSASTTFNIGHESASFRVRAASGQTAAIQEWRNSSESVLASVSAAGDGSFKGLTTDGPVTLDPGGSSDPLMLNHLAYVYGSSSASSAHRIALGAGMTGDALFISADMAAANLALGEIRSSASSDVNASTQNVWVDTGASVALTTGTWRVVAFYHGANSGSSGTNVRLSASANWSDTNGRRIGTVTGGAVTAGPTYTTGGTSSAANLGAAGLVAGEIIAVVKMTGSGTLSMQVTNSTATGTVTSYSGNHMVAIRLA